MSVRLYPVDGGLALESPFNPELVADIKSLPYADRRWDAARRAWIVAPAHGQRVADIVASHLGVSLVLPDLNASPAAPQIKMLKLEYLGRCKERELGATATASGFADGGWSLVFPEPVLRAWFSADVDPESDSKQTTARPDAAPTLYAVLAVKQAADAEAIKKSYRQLVKHWHPDVCREPDAREQFECIQHAWEVLGNSKTRRKYDAGLALAAMQAASDRPYGRPKNMAVRRHDDDAYGYRSPLRCGLLLVEGAPRVGQFVVSKILKWEDIVINGRTMVASWANGGTTFQVDWV